MVIAFICVFIVSVFFDADMTTLLYEKYGKNVGEDLKGKVIWITGASTGEADLCYRTVTSHWHVASALSFVYFTVGNGWLS